MNKEKSCLAFIDYWMDIIQLNLKIA